MSHTQKTRLSIGGIAIILSLLLLPLEIPKSISTQGKLIPSKSWVLMRNDNGMIVSILRDNETGHVQRYNITQLERGDALRFTLSDLAQRGTVSKGDTVAWTYSTDVEYEIATLQGSLRVAEAAYESARTGEKPSLVEAAERELLYARKAVDEQQVVFQRQKELHERKLISDEEYERAENQLEMLRISVSIAEARLTAVSSGMKTEDLLQRKEELDAIRGELRAMQQRLALASHVAPISGALRATRAADTLLIVDDAAEALLFMPVELSERPNIPADAVVAFQADELGVSGKARVIRDDGQVTYFDGKAITMIVARVTKQDGNLPHGLVTQCSVTAEPMSLGAAIIDFLGGLLE
ncbi:hypothetical protein KQI65_13480 [bacterium]|nr:hypothetical protein [bacterium]